MKEISESGSEAWVNPRLQILETIRKAGSDGCSYKSLMKQFILSGWKRARGSTYLKDLVEVGIITEEVTENTNNPEHRLIKSKTFFYVFDAEE